MLNLNPTDLAILQSILKQYVPNSIVWAFGSRVKGTAHEGSDLDLVIINPADERILQENLSEMREALSESDLPFLVDVLDWAEIPEKFREEIKKHHEVF